MVIASAAAALLITGCKGQSWFNLKVTVPGFGQIETTIGPGHLVKTNGLYPELHATTNGAPKGTSAD